MRFVGGTNEMPAGSSGYFDVDLKPGRHAWVAEVLEPGRKGTLECFIVQ